MEFLNNVPIARIVRTFEKGKGTGEPKEFEICLGFDEWNWIVCERQVGTTGHFARKKYPSTLECAVKDITERLVKNGIKEEGKIKSLSKLIKAVEGLKAHICEVVNGNLSGPPKLLVAREEARNNPPKPPTKENKPVTPNNKAKMKLRRKK